MSLTKPRVILGCMTFGPPGTESKGARVTSIDEYTACLDTLAKNGYLELDTARVYIDGDQEKFTAEAKYAERGFSIATKCFPVEAGMHSPERLKATLNKSLRELGASCVDIFYLHAPDRTVPFEDTLKACDELFKQGKFVTLGLSNYAAWEVAEMVNIARKRGLVQPKIYQAMYNAITRAIEPELIPCCRKYGIDIVVYNPLAGGLFSGKYTTLDTPESGRFSATNERQGKLYRDRYFQSPTLDALKIIEPVVKQHNLTLIETALRWVVHHSKLKLNKQDGGNDGIIIGVSSLKQLESNIADLEKGPLPKKVVEVLDQAWAGIAGSCPSYWR